MKLTQTAHFKRDYKKLSVQIQERVDKQLGHLVRDSTHPSLRIKRVRRFKDVFEGSITRDYRFLFQITSSGYTLLRVGKHDILDK